MPARREYGQPNPPTDPNRKWHKICETVANFVPFFHLEFFKAETAPALARAAKDRSHHLYQQHRCWKNLPVY